MAEFASYVSSQSSFPSLSFLIHQLLKHFIYTENSEDAVCASYVFLCDPKEKQWTQKTKPNEWRSFRSFLYIMTANCVSRTFCADEGRLPRAFVCSWGIWTLRLARCWTHERFEFFSHLMTHWQIEIGHRDVCDRIVRHHRQACGPYGRFVIFSMKYSNAVEKRCTRKHS